MATLSQFPSLLCLKPLSGLEVFCQVAGQGGIFARRCEISPATCLSQSPGLRPCTLLPFRALGSHPTPCLLLFLGLYIPSLRFTFCLSHVLVKLTWAGGRVCNLLKSPEREERRAGSSCQLGGVIAKTGALGLC